ncbi:Spore outer coat protein CotC [Bacillus subtilis subsp. subtilis str. BSP1]|nr:Spore outer coat protein CotC [Bacillus subtilis subsp. subtilis str. BSP1]
MGYYKKYKEEYYTVKKTYYKKYYEYDKKYYDHHDKKYDDCDYDKKYDDYDKKYYDHDKKDYDYVVEYKKHKKTLLNAINISSFLLSPAIAGSFLFVHYMYISEASLSMKTLVTEPKKE